MEVKKLYNRVKVKTPYKRHCTECKVRKEIEHFNKSKQATVSGYSSICSDCESKRVVVEFVMPTEKLCKSCSETKLISEFSLNSARRDKSQEHCKSCFATKRLKSKEETKVYMKNWRINKIKELRQLEK